MSEKLEDILHDPMPLPYKATGDVELAQIWGPDGDELAKVYANFGRDASAIATAKLMVEAANNYERLQQAVAQMREALADIRAWAALRMGMSPLDEYRPLHEIADKAIKTAGTGDYHNPQDVQRIAELEGIIAGYKAAQEIELDAIRNAMNAKHQFHSAALRNEGERAIVGDAVKVFQATNEAAEGYARLPDGLTFTVEHITRDGKRMYLEGTYEGTPLRVWAASCYLTD